LNGDIKHFALGGGLFYSRKISNKFSIYSELQGSWRNYGDITISPSLNGEFTSYNLALYIGHMFDIGKKSNLSLGLGQNFLPNPDLKTKSGNIDISNQTTNFTSLFFDFRQHIYKEELSIGFRYEWGLNSILKSKDINATILSFNIFYHLSNQNKKGKK
jgi:hypothetical protein